MTRSIKTFVSFFMHLLKTAREEFKTVFYHLNSICSFNQLISSCMSDLATPVSSILNTSVQDLPVLKHICQWLNKSTQSQRLSACRGNKTKRSYIMLWATCPEISKNCFPEQVLIPLRISIIQTHGGMTANWYVPTHACTQSDSEVILKGYNFTGFGNGIFLTKKSKKLYRLHRFGWRRCLQTEVERLVTAESSPPF